MSQELIYTSAPKGLKLGARGFCTVASTTGMAKNLADRLEALTGYKHLFPPDSPQAFQNPVNYSYLRFALGGQTHCVLSRIADAGLDYTQRSNKIAHHIVLGHSELAAAGPASLASQPGVFETAWSKDPQLLTQGRQLPTGEVSVGICKTWQAVAGDAGWAGVLAEHASKNTSDEAYLVYKPGTDVLRLFLEAQSLLSFDVRWNTTFSTYFTKLPPGIECRWRAVVEGTPESLSVRRPGTLIIDLTKILPKPADGEFVAIARSGDTLRRDGTDTTGRHDPGRHSDRQEFMSGAPNQSIVGRDNTSWKPQTSKPPALPGQRITGWIPTYSGAALSRRERAVWIASLVTLIALSAGIVVYFKHSPSVVSSQTMSDGREISDDQSSNIDARFERGEPLQTAIDSAPDVRADDTRNESTSEKPSDPSSDERAQVSHHTSSVSKSASKQDELTQGVVSNESIELQQSDSKVNVVNWSDVTIFRSEVALPTISQSLTNDKWKLPVTFAEFQQIPDVDLTLYSTDNSTRLDRGLDQSSDKWKVFCKSADGPPRHLATIAFSSDGELQFQWSEEATKLTASAEALRASILILSLRGENRFVSFLPAGRFVSAIDVDEEELTKRGKWRVPTRDGIWIPSSQTSSVYIRVDEIKSVDIPRIALTPGQPKYFPLKIGEIELGAHVEELAGNTYSLSMTLHATDDDTGSRTPYPVWRRSTIAERRQLLQEAVASYAARADKSMLRDLKVQLDFPIDDTGALPPGNVQEFLRKIRKIDVLEKVEKTLREKLTEQHARQYPMRPHRDEPKYSALQSHEERFPDLLDMDNRVKRLLSDAKVHLRVTRQVVPSDQHANHFLPEIDVLVIGQE